MTVNIEGIIVIYFDMDNIVGILCGFVIARSAGWLPCT